MHYEYLILRRVTLLQWGGSVVSRKLKLFVRIFNFPAKFLHPVETGMNCWKQMF